MRKEQLFWGIEDGLSDWDSCLDAFKVFYMKFDYINIIEINSYRYFIVYSPGHVIVRAYVIILAFYSLDFTALSLKFFQQISKSWVGFG